jgi:hypothetical protein
MTRILALWLFLGAPIHLAAQGALDSFGAAQFTSDGTSLAASVKGWALQLEITPLHKNTTTLRLALNDTGLGEPSFIGVRPCAISISTSNRVAAIGISEMAKSGSEQRRRGIFIALVDLETNRWGKHYFIVPIRSPGNIPRFVGFWGDSDELVFITDTDTSSRVITVDLIDTSDGNVTRTTEDLKPFPPTRRVFFDARNRRAWLAFEARRVGDEKMNVPILRSISLAADKKEPIVGLANLRAEHTSTKWLVPETMAFPNLTTIVFGENNWAAGFGPNRLWVADLATASLREMSLPRDLGEALMHGLGLTWYEQVIEPIALSPDERFAVIPITLEALGPPYIVDNYVSKGIRLVVVDLQRLRVVSSIKPEHDRKPVGFALDHREGKVTLLVNWHDDWKHLEFAVPQQ